jgi:hypothetical protein
MFRQAVKDGFGNPHGSGKHLNSRSFRLLNFGGSAHRLPPQGCVRDYRQTQKRNGFLFFGFARFFFRKK